MLTYLVVQPVARPHLNAYDISTSGSDKVRLDRVSQQNHVLYHILNKHFEGVSQNLSQF